MLGKGSIAVVLNDINDPFKYFAVELLEGLIF